MMHVLPCARVRADLSAYHDRELPIEILVLIRSHLQECVACRLEASSLDELGDQLRSMSASLPSRPMAETGRLTSAVLERVRVEQELSLGVRVRALFEDMHLVWAGLGASLAMLICIFASAGVLQAASQEKPDSLAGIISTIARADSNDLVRLAGTMVENRALLDSTEAFQSSDSDAELMLSAIVTRDGRIQSLELLEEDANSLLGRPDALQAMLSAASRARFERAEFGSLPAVNVVWLVTSTTVKGQPNYDLYLLRPPRWSPPVTLPALPPKPQTPAVKSTVAGEDGVTAV